jgi:signal transduction histidine kinase
LIKALRPASLADRGLAWVLSERATDWSRRTSILVHVRIQGERETPLDVEEALYHVAEEALANVARHSAARSVELGLTWSETSLLLTVQDDGNGFDVASALSRGVGLASMRERLESFGGTLSVTSSSAGTRIDASLPLPPSALEVSYA